jgi:hypothetical protein
VLLEVPTRVLPCLAAASGVGVAPESGADKGAADKGADQMGAASAVSPLRLADFLTDSYRMGTFCGCISGTVTIVTNQNDVVFRKTLNCLYMLCVFLTLGSTIYLAHRFSRFHSLHCFSPLRQAV